MSAGLVLLFLAALALVAAAASALVGALLVAGRAWLERRDPAAQVRLLFAAALAPALAATAFVCAASADFALHGAGDHRCVTGNLGAWPSLWAAALLALVAGRALARGLRAAARLWVARAGRRRLDAASSPRAAVRVLDVDEPQAFVAGLWRPRIYLSRGLVAALDAAALDAVIAHERAHARGRDPLRRIVVSAALGLHLPFVARRLARRFSVAQELAADRAAQSAVGSATRVAEVLLRTARLRLGRPAAAAALAGGDLELRIAGLLRRDARATGPSARALVAGSAAAFALALAGAAPAHDLLELLLRLVRGS